MRKQVQCAVRDHFSITQQPIGQKIARDGENVRFVNFVSQSEQVERDGHQCSLQPVIYLMAENRYGNARQCVEKVLSEFLNSEGTLT